MFSKYLYKSVSVTRWSGIVKCGKKGNLLKLQGRGQEEFMKLCKWVSNRIWNHDSHISNELVFTLHTLLISHASWIECKRVSRVETKFPIFIITYPSSIRLFHSFTSTLWAPIRCDELLCNFTLFLALQSAVEGIEKKSGEKITATMMNKITRLWICKVM